MQLGLRRAVDLLRVRRAHTGPRAETETSIGGGMTRREVLLEDSGQHTAVLDEAGVPQGNELSSVSLHLCAFIPFHSKHALQIEG